MPLIDRENGYTLHAPDQAFLASPQPSTPPRYRRNNTADRHEFLLNNTSLFLAGLFNASWLQRGVRFQANVMGGRPLIAYVLGVAFTFGWTPCIGPVLGAILAVSTVSPAVSRGVASLGVYSLGLKAMGYLAAARCRSAPVWFWSPWVSP
jgi:hypothetical protein